MLREHTKKAMKEASDQKKAYQSPRLVHYGAVQNLTQTGSGGGIEMAEGMNMCMFDPFARPCSERRVKENILRVGNHPLGIGLYLFDYKPEYLETWGHGRQFGVMIDEVETVMPEAVSVHADGYKVVDYAMLGISRALY